MNFTDLTNLKSALGIENQTVRGGQINISTDTLTDNINTLLNYCYDNQPIVIDDAHYVSEDAGTNTVVIKGKSNFLDIAGLAVQAHFSVDSSGDAQVFIKYALLGDMPGPNDWKFSRSFRQMPKVADENDPTFFDRATQAVYQTMVAPLDQLYLFNAYCVVTSTAQQEPEFQVGLKWGINFVSHVRAQGVLGIIENLFQHKTTLTLYGTIRKPIPTETAQKLALQFPESPEMFLYPWDIVDKFPLGMPGILLQIDLDLNYSVIHQKVQFAGKKFYLYTPLDEQWVLEGTNPRFVPIHAFTGSLALPEAGLEVDVVAPRRIGVDELYLIGSFQGVSLDHMAHLAGLTGSGDSPLGELPPQIQQLGDELGKLELVSAAVAVDYIDLSDVQVSYTSFTIGMPDLNWQVWKGHFDIDSVYCAFQIYYPLNAAIGADSIYQRELEVTVYGKMEIESVPFTVYASNQEGFTLYAEMDAQETLPLKQVLAKFAPEIPEPSDLEVDIFRISIAPHRAYSMALAMAEEPNPWVIPIGPKSLPVTDVSMGFTYPVGGPAQGSVSGTVALGDIATLSLTYDTPGDVIIRSLLPKAHLNDVVSTLSNQGLPVPHGFDLTLTDSSILIQKVGHRYTFQLATEIDAMGSFALQIEKVTDAHWGTAFGLDLTSIKPSHLPGLSFLSVFEEMFSLQKFLVVASSFRAPQFQFPDLANFNNPRISAKRIALPPQATMLDAGLNIFAEWVIDTHDKKQKLLQKFLGLDPAIGITLEVGKTPQSVSKLFVSYTTRINKHPFTCEFGGLMQASTLGLFLTGSMTVNIQHQPQTFDVTLLFVPNGAFISADMKGSSAVHFWAFQLAQLALEVGIDWEGIPSLGVSATIDVGTFQSSVAVFFDSADPAQSLVAGSVSDLTLKDVLDELTGTLQSSTVKHIESHVPGEGANMSKVSGELVHLLDKQQLGEVLSKVAIKGTHSFEISGDLADELDNRQLHSVAAEFYSKGGFQIPSSLSQVLLVINTQGSLWYITDLTNLDQYELRKQGAMIIVSLEAQFRCVPQATYLATRFYPQGFFINGKIEFLGFDAMATINISVNTGIAVDARMTPVVIGDKALFSLTTDETDPPHDSGGGPRVSIATYYQANEPAGFREPHFYINGQLEMLGLSKGVYCSLTTKGFVFDLHGDLLPAIFFDVHAHFDGPTNFGADGGLKVGIGTIDLGILGHVKIASGVDGALAISVAGREIEATLDASFEFAGDTHKIAKFDLDISTQTFEKLADTLANKVKDILEDALNDAETWAGDVKKGFITGVDDVRHVLQTRFGKTAQEATQIMESVGKKCGMTAAVHHL